MCRLFGFRSVIPSQVHRSLMEADNAIMHQSQIHSDGWGVAYYVAGAPHLIRATDAAVDSSLFQKVSGIVASETVLAHIRKATQGSLCITNTHPFQYGNWVFMHNGNVKNFAGVRDQLVELIQPKMARYILGNTDSEVLFYLLLSRLARRVDLHRKGCGIDEIADAVRETVDLVTDLVGPLHLDPNGPSSETYLTFILTNGTSMIAHQGGKSLFYSTYKGQCSERDTCPCFAAECEAPTRSGYVNHLLFSSEPIRGENVWLEMNPGDIIGIDWTMRLARYGAKSTAISV